MGTKALESHEPDGEKHGDELEKDLYGVDNDHECPRWRMHGRPRIRTGPCLLFSDASVGKFSDNYW